MTIDEVSRATDVDGLWQALLAAKAAGDLDRQRAIEARMRDLQEQRRFAHLSDEDLAAQIRALQGQREVSDTLAHNPGAAADGSGWGAADVVAINDGIKANQHAGVETTLAALVEEWKRRGLA